MISDNELKERYTRLREKVIMQRSRMKTEFDDFRERVQTKLKPEYIDKLGINVDELTAEHWLPHLYVEPFDGKKYEEEMLNTQKFLDGIVRFKEELKEQAIKEMGDMDV